MKDVTTYILTPDFKYLKGSFQELKLGEDITLINHTPTTHICKDIHTNAEYTFHFTPQSNQPQEVKSRRYTEYELSL